jgi:hypothetical protein
MRTTVRLARSAFHSSEVRAFPAPKLRGVGRLWPRLKRRWRPPRLWKLPFKKRKPEDYDNIGACHGDRQQRQTGSAGHADSRSYPYRGCGRQTSNEVLPSEDHPAEPDARNNLRGHSRRIENDTAIRGATRRSPLSRDQSGHTRGAMCNLYSLTKGQAAIRDWFRAQHDRTGNLPLFPGIFPDQFAPILRTRADGERELVMARWGMPGPR